jgi:hypothetical protein
MRGTEETCNALWEATAGKTIVTSKPKEAWLALTGRCNLACLHCPRDAETVSNENLTASVLDKVFKDVFPHLDTLLLGGNNLGEQFIARGAERVVDEASRQGVKIVGSSSLLVRWMCSSGVACDIIGNNVRCTPAHGRGGQGPPEIRCVGIAVAGPSTSMIATLASVTDPPASV